MFGGYRREMGRSTQFLGAVADEQWVKLFGRDDAEKTSSTTGAKRAGTTRPKSRLNEQCAKLREVHVELDDIEGRLTALRAKHAASRLRATAPRPGPGNVATLDLRTLEDVEVTQVRLDSGVLDVDVPDTGATEAPGSDSGVRQAGVIVAEDAGNAIVDVATDDDFEKRFAAFAAGESDDSSRRWLDTD